MADRDIVLKYLKCFCGGDIDGMQTLLTEDCCLTGPLYRFNSRDEYIQSLQKDPPEPAACEIIEIVEGAAGILILYRYEKSTGPLTIAQFFRLKDNQIRETLLVFDSKSFA